MGAKGIAGGLVGGIAGFAIGGPIGAVALGASGFGAGESVGAADQAVKAAKANRAILDSQAAEAMRRAEFNRQQTLSEGETNRGDQVSAFVRGGVDVSSQSSLIAMENAQAKYQEQAYFSYRDSELSAASARTQAQMQVDQAKRGREAAQIGAFTSLLGTAASVGMMSTKKVPPGTNKY